MRYIYNNYYEILKNAAQRYGNFSIIFTENEKTTYNQLLNQVENVKNYLIKTGIWKNNKISTIISNSKEFIIIFFTVVSLAAAAVVLNKFFKKEEFRFILNDCEVRLLFALACLKTKVKNLNKDTVTERII